MKTNILRRLLFALFAAVLLTCAANADYSFKVPKSEAIVMLETDGSMTVSVSYEFVNLGQKLDYIDIGLPNNNFSIGDVQVSLNGEVDRKIKVVKADYQQTGLRYGITLEMGGESIPNGESATIDVVIPNIKKNMFEATSETKDEQEIEYVGFEFSPNYFGKKYVSGKTEYSFVIVFPYGVTSEQVYYYSPQKWPGEENPDAWISDDGRIVYNWVSSSADICSEYIFGGKYPKSILTSTSNLVVPSSGSGSSSDDAWWEMPLGMLVCFAPIIGFIIWIVKKIKDASKTPAPRTPRSYLPPQIKTDGEGIKRGLTAVEAAIILETDLERVISMILYGLSKKEVIVVKSHDPLDVEIADPLPENIYEYEKNFIEALREPDLKGKRTKMRNAMQELIMGVTKKMEGFSLKETQEYYRGICEKAWKQVEDAETPELKSKLLGDNFGWAMLDEKPEKKIEETFSGYDMLPPTWWWRVDPGYRRPAAYSYSSPSDSHKSSGSSGSEKRSGSSSSSSPKPSAMPVLPGAMFARSITNSARGLSTAMVGDMSRFKASVRGKTNPVPISSSSGHSSGGGSSSCACACACACAGCACACAGGGR